MKTEIQVAGEAKAKLEFPALYTCRGFPFGFIVVLFKGPREGTVVYTDPDYKGPYHVGEWGDTWLDCNDRRWKRVSSGTKITLEQE